MTGSILKKQSVFALLVVGITLLLFARFTSNYFVYDDFRYLENNLYGVPEVLLGYNTLRLVSNVIWAPLYGLFGFNPVAYNIFSLLLYAGNALLLAVFVETLFNNRTTAFFAALFFVLSGVGADAVFWKCSSNALLCLCFYLLTLTAYVRFRRGGMRSAWYVSLLWYLLAIFSKEEAASLPALIVMLELLFLSGKQERKTVLVRALPYGVIICFYLLLNKVVFGWLALAPAELAKFYVVRPLYSLFGGLSAFILAPNGVLHSVNPLAYFAAVAVLASLLLVREKKILLFAFAWVILTFIPQSLTSVGQLEPRFIANSISRYLYIVSIGPALLYGALLADLKERVSPKRFIAVALVSVGIFGLINYRNVQQRGQQWREEAAPMAFFFTALDRIMPLFPPRSFVYVDNAPTGRSSVQQAMRCYYRNPSITWIVNPESYRRKPGDRAFLIAVEWEDDHVADMKITEPWPESH